VQRVPGRRLHGRRGCAFPRRCARDGRGDRPAGDRASHHGRRVRRGNALGDAPGALLQVERGQTHFPNGPAPSPLRALGVEGIAGRRALLDHHHDAGPVRSVHFEAAVNLAGRKVLVLGLGDTGLSMAKWLSRRGASVRVADTRASPPAGSMARAAGADCEVAGNIGPAVLDALMRREDKGQAAGLWVLELSSFQLETTTSLAADAATVLNVTEDHLDRYRGIDDYVRAKARIFSGDGIQVLNRDDPRSLALADRKSTRL